MKKLFLVFFLIGCAESEQVVVQDHVDAEMKVYVDQFEAKLGKNLSPLWIGFDDLDVRSKTLPDGRIVLDFDTWINSSPEHNRVTVFHELGHKYLGKSDGVGIMESEPTWPAQYYRDNWDDLVDDLFCICQW